MGIEREDGLTKLQRAFLKRRVCGFCEVSLLASHCGALSGEYALPIIEGVRDQEEVVDLGPPCNMAERRASALAAYKPRTKESPHA